MQQELRFGSPSEAIRAISPYVELGAWEALWSERSATTKRVADRFRERPGALPSELVDRADALEKAAWVLEHLRAHGVERFGVRVHGDAEYPPCLRDARHPPEVLMFQGYWNLVESPGVAVVGTRNATPDGLRRAASIARRLVGDGYTVISGLAQGVDTAAHTAAMETGGRTIAVIGTPLSESYPPTNADLQQRIAAKHLVISHIPVFRHTHHDWRVNRSWFPERNVTMSALSLATVIVEAGEGSGTLRQAKAALQQGRSLFVLDACFRRADLTWPAKMVARGAVRIRSYEQLLAALGGQVAPPNAGYSA